MEQAVSDAEILKTLEGGATALERLNKDIGGIERVEKIMDRVREGVEESEDVGRVIAEMGRERVDEGEVQEEFNEMFREEEEKERKLKEALERERKEREDREREKRVREQLAELEREKEKVEVEEKKGAEAEEGLVQELQSVSIDPSPSEKGKEEAQLEEPIPS